MSRVWVRRVVGLQLWWQWSVFVGVYRVLAVITADVGGRGGRGQGIVARAFGFRTVVPADLYHALEVHVHRVGELECLEVRERYDGRRRAEVLDLLELVHDLRSDHATVVVDQLYGRSLAVVRHAVPHQHVELVLLVLDGQHHGHGLADLHDTGHLGRPRAFAHLDLHPTLQVVAEEIGRDRVQHVYLERLECDGLLIEVVPRATQLARLVPDLLHVRVVLDDDRVLHVAATGSLPVTGHGTGSRTAGRCHSAAVQKYLERGAQMPGAGFHVHAMWIAVEACEQTHARYRWSLLQ